VLQVCPHRALRRGGPAAADRAQHRLVLPDDALARQAGADGVEHMWLEQSSVQLVSATSPSLRATRWKSAVQRGRQSQRLAERGAADTERGSRLALGAA
jgi:hypothetical protein